MIHWKGLRHLKIFHYMFLKLLYKYLKNFIHKNLFKVFLEFNSTAKQL